MLDDHDADHFRAALTQVGQTGFDNLLRLFVPQISFDKKLNQFYDALCDLPLESEARETLLSLKSVSQRKGAKVAQQLRELIRGEDDRRREAKAKEIEVGRGTFTRKDAHELHDDHLELLQAILTESCDSDQAKRRFVWLGIKAMCSSQPAPLELKRKLSTTSEDQMTEFIGSMRDHLAAEVQARSRKAVSLPERDATAPEGSSGSKASPKKPKARKG